MSDIRELQKLVGEINLKNGWRETPELSPELQVKQDITELALITTEVAEAIEEIRNGHAADEVYLSYPPVPPSYAVEFASGQDAQESWERGERGKPEGVPSELADVVIRVLDFADKRNIDMDAEIQRKLKYNTIRGYRHGGKAV